VYVSQKKWDKTQYLLWVLKDTKGATFWMNRHCKKGSQTEYQTINKVMPFKHRAKCFPHPNFLLCIVFILLGFKIDRRCSSVQQRDSILDFPHIFLAPEPEERAGSIFHLPNSTMKHWPPFSNNPFLPINSCGARYPSRPKWISNSVSL
jgi:hypothetical protein